jgi:hypothetical protein
VIARFGDALKVSRLVLQPMRHRETTIVSLVFDARKRAE